MLNCQPNMYWYGGESVLRSKASEIASSTVVLWVTRKCFYEQRGGE